MAQHQLVDRLILKAPPDEDHPRAAEELPHHREVEIGAAEAVEHREIVLIGEAAGRRAVDIGLVGEEDAGRMLAQHRPQLRQLRRVDLHLGRVAAEHHAVEPRSEEHTSELQSLMRISYAVFCWKKKTKKSSHPKTPT